MSQQTSNKTGVKSSAEKQDTTRHGNAPMPATSPVPGAFGKEGGTKNSNDYNTAERPANSEEEEDSEINDQESSAESAR